MNDDYLWDKTGQPDPEIQQLEEILGTLRYQPKPLVLPRPRNYFPLLAIAASILLALIAGSIWLRMRPTGDIPAQLARIELAAPPPPTDRSAANQPLQAPKKIHRKRSASSAQQEALMAKEQLMLALRVTTQKLHLVHTRTE